MKRHVERTSKPLDVVPWARATQLWRWHGDEKRPPTVAASKLCLEKCQKYLAKLRWNHEEPSIFSIMARLHQRVPVA
jgi:hypothetical protein